MGFGEDIHFSDDIWCVNSPLKKAFHDIYLVANDSHGLVADYFDHEGGRAWCINLRRNLIDWEGDIWLRLLGWLEEFRPSVGLGIDVFGVSIIEENSTLNLFISGFIKMTT